MKFIADLHIHSRFSRATARNLDPEHLSLWAQKKGIAVIGTGDFTHPGWVTELKEKLVEAEPGLYRLRPEIQEQVDVNVPPSCHSPSRFVLSGEISCIYKKAGKTRKVHHLILMPDFASVERFNDQLSRVGNVASDGRPILGLDSRVLLEMALQASDRTFFIPAHVWTPWFSLFGSKSGFDTLEECFDDLSPYIHALETGLSSDPPMNRRLSQLDRYLLVSNSDAHSPANLGREANLFDTGLSYGDMVGAMTRGEGFCGTIEFFPEEGKYHLDGHRKCEVRLEPIETKGLNGLCPACGRPLTVGVLHRVDDLADRKESAGRMADLHKPFFSLIPLAEILSELLGCGRGTVKVETLYERLLAELGPELPILMDLQLGRLEKAAGPVLAEAIGRMRKGEVIRAPGYDGEYGTIRLFAPGEMGDVTGQMAFFQTPEKSAPIEASLQPTKRTHEATPAGQKFTSHVAPSPAPPHDDPILGPLNNEQRQAVLSSVGHLLAAAGPGTGKTAVLTHRMAYLIREGTAAAKDMLALTFTRKAAGEMAQRLSVLLNHSTDVRVETFHGFCLQVLRDEPENGALPRDFSLCSEREAEEIANEVADEGKLGKRIVRRFLKALPHLKISDGRPAGGESAEDEIQRLFRRYQARLRALGMVDFDDLEVETLRLFRDHPEVCHRYGNIFRWVFVDEYQDTNPIQAELVKTLVNGGCGRVFAIGDPDQAIYGFRGADQANFFRFPLDFPSTHTISLTRNYRSSGPILQAAAAILLKDQALIPSSPGGDPVMLSPCRTEAEEAEMVVEQIERLMGGTSHFVIDSGRTGPGDGEPSLGFGDFAVLYRLNAQGLALEEAFKRAGIPYARSGETPLVARYPVNLLWRFLQTRTYPENPYYAKAYADLLSASGLKPETLHQEALLSGTPAESIETAVRFHGIDCEEERTKEPLSGLRRFASGFGGDLRSFVDGLSLERGIDHTRLPGDRVALMSLHAAKGLEWPVVFITGCEDQLLPCTLFGDRDDEEERRLLYVGMTRARRRLILSWAQRRTLSGRSLHMAPSPFLSLIPGHVCQNLERKRPKPRAKSGKQLSLFA
jgi:DNA helicase-2/ATP-dependent DNA helicase PcrA